MSAVDRAEMAARLAGYEAQTSVDAAHVSAKQAKKAQDAADPVKQATREHNQRVRLELLGQEQSALARFNPRRNRWPDLLKIGRRIEEIEQLRNNLNSELQATRESLGNAINADRQALAEWALAGGTGAKPEPTAPAVEERITDMATEYDATELALNTLLMERVAFVARHRGRLVKDAEQAVADAREQLQATVCKLVADRGELVAVVETAAWARVYPDASLASSLPRDLLMVGKALDKFLPGFRGQASVNELERLLLEDANVLSTEAPADQVAAYRGQSEREVLGREADWGDNPQKIKAEKQARIDAHIKEWGFAPGEWR